MDVDSVVSPPVDRDDAMLFTANVISALERTARKYNGRELVESLETEMDATLRLEQYLASALHKDNPSSLLGKRVFSRENISDYSLRFSDSEMLEWKVSKV
jgi:hypothetical protein